VTQTSNRQKVTIAAVATAWFLCYAGVLVGIVGAWSRNYLYSYGFAVPVITGYMLWARKRELREAPWGPDYKLGVAVTGSGTAMLLVGHFGTVESVESVSIVVTALGSVLLLFGRSVFRIAWFPILYLILGIPVWDRLIADLQIPSQRLSAAIAVVLLRLVGIPAIQDQTFIVLPNLTLEVLRECSGVNQLISVAAMSLAASYLWLESSARRIMLVATSIAVGYLSNGLRIAVVGILGHNGWTNVRVGALHLAEGLAVSVIGYAVIFGCLSLLSRHRPFEFGRSVSGTGRSLGAARTSALALPRMVSLDAAIVVFLLCAGILRTTFHAPAVRLNTDLLTLPSQIAEWSMDPLADSTPGFRLAGADNELFRAYRHPSGKTIRFYVGYHQYQQEGKELLDGNNRTDQGESSQVSLVLPSEETVALNQIVERRPDSRKGVLFWYDVNGRIVTSLYLAKGFTIWDALTSGRTNGAFVRIEWSAADAADFEHARQMALGFADAVVPLLREYLPSQHARRADARASIESATP